jgi:hypothetical protein
MGTRAAFAYDADELALLVDNRRNGTSMSYSRDRPPRHGGGSFAAIQRFAE